MRRIHLPHAELCGRWQPAALVTSDIIILKLMLGAAALIRAGDYVHGAADRYGLIEAAFPLPVWAIWSWTVGALILVGIAAQRHIIVWLGHSLGAGLYGLLAIAQLGNSFDNWPPATEVTSAVPWHVWATMSAFLVTLLPAAALTATGSLHKASWAAAIVGITITAALIAIAHVPADGIRGILPLGTLSILHTMFAVRSGPRPLRADEAIPVETANAPAGN